MHVGSAKITPPSALRACPGVPPDSRLRRLVVSGSSVELEFLADLVDALDALPGRIRLILDDAHHLATRWRLCSCGTIATQRR